MSKTTQNETNEWKALQDAQEKEAKGYFNLYFMLFLDHISYFHSLSPSITICHHRRSFHSSIKAFCSSLAPHSHTQTAAVNARLGCDAEKLKIMKPFTQYRRQQKVSCLMLSTTKSLLMMSHYPFFSLSLSRSATPPNIGGCHNAILNKA